ncbi:MAG: tRNA lysidine(34) synthetase TilS [Candidatus Moraniibacteriota bacterium]
MDKLIKKIQTFSHQFDLWQEGAKIVVGVSGGPDSVCLLDILVRLAKKRKFELLVVHVNYGLRTADSDKDEIFVRKLAEKYGLNLEVLNAKKESQKNHTENFLRDIRYDFFEKIRKENKFNLIAVAHNQDDQAETILMRLIRGSGLLGLSSIRPRNNRIVRPLLNTSRQEIIAYLKENKLKYRIDKTNLKDKFLRNKIRNKLIPLMEEKYNPILKETLANSAGSIADDYDFIYQSAQRVFKKIDFNKDKNAYFFESKKFLKNHRALQKQILRMIIFGLRDNLLNIENAHLEEILKIIKSDKNKSQIMLFKKLKIAKKGDIIYISTEE